MVYLLANKLFPIRKATQAEVEDDFEFSENAHKQIWADKSAASEDEDVKGKEDDEFNTNTRVIEVA